MVAWVSLFFIYYVCQFATYFSRQIPGLPRAAAGTSKKVKKNVSGINGRILDPIARSAAQRAARQIALPPPGPRRPSIGNENNDFRVDENPDVEKDQDQDDLDGNVGDEHEQRQRSHVNDEYVPARASEDDAPPRITTNFPARIAGTPYPHRVGYLLKGLFYC